MKTWQNYDPDLSGPMLLSSTAYRVAIILFDDYLTHRTDPVRDWFGPFQLNVLDVLNRIGFTEEETVYVLRSQRFCLHVQDNLRASKRTI